MEKLLGLNTYAEELGINLDTEEGRFKWFLASILFAKRISSEIAKKTYREFERHGVTLQQAARQTKTRIRALDVAELVWRAMEAAE